MFGMVLDGTDLVARARTSIEKEVDSIRGDCPKDWCVTGAIFNYTNQLMDASENSKSIIVHYNLTEALMFLSIRCYSELNQSSSAL